MTVFNSLLGQSLTDIAIQVYGSAEGVAFLMADNPWIGSLDYVPSPGTAFKIRSTAVNAAAENISNQFKDYNINVGSAPLSQLSGGTYVHAGYVNGGYTV